MPMTQVIFVIGNKMSAYTGHGLRKRSDIVVKITLILNVITSFSLKGD